MYYRINLRVDESWEITFAKTHEIQPLVSVETESETETEDTESEQWSGLGRTTE